MKLRNHLQEQKGVAAWAAANVYGEATLVIAKQISDVFDWFVIGSADSIVFARKPREMILHSLHV
jgi:hypothetical protein